ncbi:MAG: murein hydrolase activator EnvC family protein [Bacteroidales bacterium]
MVQWLCQFSAIKCYFFVLLLSVCVFDCSYAGSRKDDLIRRRERISKEIATSENLLKKLTENKKEVENKMALINRKIDLRRELLANMNDEISLLDKTIDSLTRLLITNRQIIGQIKSEYALVIYRSYFYLRANTLLMLLFSSESVGQMYRRYLYLKQYSMHRRALIEKLRSEINSLYLNSIRLTESRNAKIQLLRLRQTELEKLNKDMEIAQNSLRDVQRQTKELQKSLERLRSAAKAIETEIKKLVVEEVKRINAEKVVSAYSRKVALISSQFEQNKGHLPFPVERGAIVSQFGEQPHPVYRSIKINNNGIDISTECGVPVYAVFAGVVSKVFFIKGSNYAIILRHGNFYTVYQNLTDVTVVTGAEVKENSILGYSFCSEGETVSRFHFEIWHQLNKLDPTEWLMQK